MSKGSGRIYFPGLNGFRFIAAELVILQHIEQDKKLFGFANAFDVPFVQICGGLAVTAFFVLSGFLLTYLLLDEKRQRGTIDVRRFYIRRALRILPLYYLTVIIGLFVVPSLALFNMPDLSNLVQNDFPAKIALLLFLLPNIVLIAFPPIPYLSQAWSIGVEEQFYLFLPLILNRTRRYFTVIIALVVGFNLVSNLIRLYPYHPTALKYVTDFLDQSRISCMGIGAIGACLLYFGKSAVLNVLFRRDVQVVSLLLLSLCLGFGVVFPYVHHEAYSVFFCLIILNLSSNKRTIISLEQPILHYLGRISYGVYMFHAVAVVMMIKALNEFLGFRYASVTENILLHLLTTSLAVGLAAISYHGYEIRFLRMKRRFARRVSGI